MKNGILLGFIIVLLVFTFFTDIFIPKHFLTASLTSVSNKFSTDLSKENNSLKLENESLKAQLQKLQIFFPISKNSQNNELSNKYISAKVFSTYPFNIKGALTIDKGSNDKIKNSQVVLVGENILLGQISEVYNNSSVVKTIYDPNWQLPVKIGEEKINGLFVGGNDPKITLLEKPVKVGDAIFVNSKDFPEFLKLGEIKEIKQENSGMLKEAAIIKTLYNVNSLDEVYITK